MNPAIHDPEDCHGASYAPRLLCHRCAESLHDRQAFYRLIYSQRGPFICEHCGGNAGVTFTPRGEPGFVIPPEVSCSLKQPTAQQLDDLIHPKPVDVPSEYKPPSMLRFLWELACGAAWPVTLVAGLGAVALAGWLISQR